MSTNESADLFTDSDTKFDIFKTCGKGTGNLKIPGKTNLVSHRVVLYRCFSLNFSD